MELILETWDGYPINDDVYFHAIFPAGSVMLPSEGSAAIVHRTHFAPKYTYKGRNVKNLPIQIGLLNAPGETIGTLRDVIARIFNPNDDDGLHLLIAHDAQDWNRQWYVEATPISVPSLVGNQITVNLMVPDPIWRSYSELGDVWSITATAQTRVLSPGGNMDAYPRYSLKPTIAKSAGGTVRYRKFVNALNPGSRVFTDYAYDLVNALWNTAVLIAAGKMQVSGSDIHVLVDGRDADYWLVDINTDHTKLWVNLNLKPKIDLTVSGGYTAGNEVITLQNTTGNKDGVYRLPSSGILLWGTERVRFTSVDGLTLTVKRGTYDSTAAIHADGSVMSWVEHEIWVVYGDTSLTDYVVSDVKKPIIDLTTSTNLIHYWYDFIVKGAGMAALPRSASWAASVINNSSLDPSWPSTLFYVRDYYTARSITLPENQSDSSGQTYSIMGMFVGATYIANQNGVVSYDLYYPSGITQVTCNGKKFYKVGAYLTSVFQSSLDGNTWVTEWTEATPAAPNVESNITHVGVALTASSPYVRFRSSFVGSGAYYGTAEIWNFSAVIDASGVPTVSVAAEVQPYLFDAVLTNQKTGESITISAAIPLNDTLEIDTLEHTIIHAEWGTVDGATVLESTIRWDVLKIKRGSNILRYDEDHARGVTLTSEWRDMNN